MQNPNKKYYYIDVNLKDNHIVECDTVNRKDALLPDDKKRAGLHRIFLIAGQYNKFLKARGR